VPLLSIVVAATAANRRGYDVFAFAEAGAALAVGLDLCPAAIAAAAQERESYLAHIVDGSARSVLGHACIIQSALLISQRPSGLTAFPEKGS